MMTKYLTLALATTVLLAACGVKSPQRQAPPEKFSEVSAEVTQEAVLPDPKVNILFVVDNSGSMRVEQANLAANFTSFIEEFNPNIKFTMGITTTDSKHEPNSMNRLNSYQMNQNRTKFINNFKEMIRVGIRGSSKVTLSFSLFSRRHFSVRRWNSPCPLTITWRNSLL